MARPTVRVLALLELLQNGGTHTVAALADRLGVDERTVRRYVEHLVELDVPVRSVRGRHGGYHLAPGFRMPPLMLTEEEALATLLGLALAHRTGLPAAGSASVDSAAAKIRRVLPERYAERIDALLDTVAVSAPEVDAVPVPSEVLLLLAEATRQRRPVTFSYRSAAGRPSTRTVRPYGLVLHRRAWFVTGADSETGQVRTFRLDRMTLPRLLPGGFEVPADFDAAAHVLAGIASAPRRFDVRLRVEGDPEEVVASFPQGLVVAEPDQAGWSRVRLQAERLDWIPAVLAGLDRRFEIHAPDALREQVRALARQLVDATTPATR